jgi:hypothetical protein
MKALARYQPKAIEGDLEQVRERFENWRENRKRGTRIPADLWQAAVSLYPCYSVNQISKTLRLGYEDVLSRVGNERDGGGKDFRFWELRLSELKAQIGECRLRAEDGAGRKVELELKSIEAGQLLQLLGGLWGER